MFERNIKYGTARALFLEVAWYLASSFFHYTMLDFLLPPPPATYKAEESSKVHAGLTGKPCLWYSKRLTNIVADRTYQLLDQALPSVSWNLLVQASLPTLAARDTTAPSLKMSATKPKSAQSWLLRKSKLTLNTRMSIPLPSTPIPPTGR